MELTSEMIKEIVKEIDKILKELYTRKQEFSNEAINWGDLHICEIRKIQILYPEPYESYELIIEEASQESIHFCECISELLFKRLSFLQARDKPFIIKAEW